MSLLLPKTILLLAVLAPPSALAQQTIAVSKLPGSTYTTIQKAIDAANNGDTVVVYPFTYKENIDFKGKAIIVTGDYPGRDPTSPLPVIDGGDVGWAVTFDTGETRTSILSYFLIQNGGLATLPPVPSQGAVLVNGTSPSILNNTLTENLCWGVYVENGTPLIQNNEIDNTLGGSCNVNGGMAISVNGDNPPGPTLISNNMIQNNVQGGENSLAVPGGGGAGIAVSSPAIIQNNTIRNNSANYSVGGGIDILASSGVYVVQNLIYGNSALCGGGGIALPGASLDPGIIALIANNTIVDNQSSPAPEGSNCAQSDQFFSPTNILQIAGPSVVIVNNILSDVAPDIPSANCAITDTPDEALQPIFDHNILYNFGGSFFNPQYCIDVSSKYGNLTAVPNFSNDTLTPYSLGANSPAIDAGNSSALQLFQQLSGELLTTDIEGNPRVINSGTTNKTYPIIDIGAYEFPGQPVTPLPTTIVLSFSQGDGQPYTLTATAQSPPGIPPGIPTGLISFFVDGVPLVSPLTNSSSAEINASGVATLTGFPLLPGTHALSATYPGHGNFSPAIAIINIVVITIIQTSIDFTYSTPGGETPAIGVPITFTVTTSATDGSIPSPVTLTDLPNTPLATFDPATATFTTSTLSQGPHTIQAAYAGTSVYAPISIRRTITIAGVTTKLNLTCGTNASLPVGATVPLVATVTSTGGIPTGNVAFEQNTTDLGSSPLSNGVAKSSAITVAGTNTFTAFFSEDNGFASSYDMCSVDVASLTLASSANPASAYSPITFTATLANNPIPAGSYSLTVSSVGYSQSVTMTPNADGSSASYTFAAGLAQGTYDVKATFTPNDHSKSTEVADLQPNQQVNAPTGDFTLTGPSTITTPTEGTATGTLTLTSIDNFSGTVALTCSLPLPTTYTCTLTPTSTPLAVNGVATATVTLAPNNLRAANNPRPGTSRIILATLLPLTLLSLAGLRRRRTNLRNLICLAALTILAASTTACGNDIFYSTTHPGAYPLTITATGTTKGGTTPSTHTLNITLNITP